ncbi:hypothetical protein DFH29DRAFT_1007404 [Suillus ampliporus]|nr:hypothetical protein DFH29DRAFT_1007404 [Suillus ampliporus]
MIIKDVTGKMVRLVKNVFTTRVAVIPDSPHGQSQEDTPQMDDETRFWPIPDDFAKEFDDIKYSHLAHPLPLYDDGRLVEPSHVNEVINGAIVEVHFAIHHWQIGNFSTFQANIQKITMLRPGIGHRTSDHKRPHPSGKVGKPEMKKTRHETDETCGQTST